MPTATILYIDDSPLNIRLVKKFLQGYDCEVISEHDVEQGIQRAIDERPDLILIDMFLPDGDGLSVFEALNRHEATATIPMIALTADDSDEMKRLCLDAGFNAFLKKPLNRSLVVKVINRYITLDENPAP